MKFIAPLTDIEQQTLQEAYRNHPSFRSRQRAHALLLNHRGYRLVKLCQFFEVQHETISGLLDQWKDKGIVGINDAPRSGRPSRYTEEEATDFVTYLDQNPHQTKAAIDYIEAQTGKSAKSGTYRRMLKKTVMSGNVAATR